MRLERATEYHFHAADCVRFAKRAANPQQRLILLIIAKAWLHLARLIEKSNPDADASWRD
jgi:hypothetical protein